MAKVIGPLHSDRVSGSVSGLQYSEYRGMAVVKRKLRPVGRDRGMQPNNRAILSALARSWGYETALNRSLWDDYAATHPVPNGMGGTFQLDGSQMYLSLNHMAVRLGTWASKKSTPPATNLNVVIDVLTATPLVAVGQVDLDWTMMGTGLVGDNVEVCMAGPFSSGGRRAVKAMLSFKVSTAGNVLTTTISDLLSNAYYWFSVRYVRADGLVSATQYAQSIVN